MCYIQYTRRKTYGEEKRLANVYLITPVMLGNSTALRMTMYIYRIC